MKLVFLTTLLSLAITASATGTAKKLRAFECGEEGEAFKVTGFIKANNDLQDVEVFQANYKKRKYEKIAEKRTVKLESFRYIKNRMNKYRYSYTVEAGGGWDPEITVTLKPRLERSGDHSIANVVSANVEVMDNQGNEDFAGLSCATKK